MSSGRLSPEAGYMALFSSPLASRMRMAASAVKTHALHRDAKAVGRAFATAARGRTPDEDRPWVANIESWRDHLSADQRLVSPGFPQRPGPSPDWASSFEGVAPVHAPAGLLSIPPLWGRLLMRLIRELRPEVCVELGTGVGLSAAYQGAALALNGSGHLLTIDAAQEWGELARTGLDQLGLGDRVELRHGLIESELEAALEDVASLDFVFIDAEHQEKPTIGHFEALVPHLSRNAVVVLDDISWKEMRRAWRTIRRHERVVHAFGLGRMGVLTFG